MEDHQRKLDFNNCIIQRQAVRRLFELVVAQREAEGPISPETPQSSELGLLYTHCADASEVIAVSSCEALVRLVLHGHAHLGTVTNGLLNAVPAAKSLVGIAGALADLMACQLISAVEGSSSTPYVCPYGIRSRPHPFISLMMSRADSWPVILRQVHRLLRWPHDSVQEHIVTLLQPFVRFSLLEPPSSQQFLQLRMSLPRVLLNSCKVTGMRLKVIQLLEDAASCLQVKTAAQMGEAVAFLDQLSEVLLKAKVDGMTTEYLQMRGQVMTHCLGLSTRAGALGSDTEGLAETAARLMKQGITDGCVPRVWLLTCQLLMTTTDRHTSHLLSIVRLCMDYKTALPLPLVSAVVLPLLKATSAPPRVGSDKRASHAAVLLRDVTTRLSAGRHNNCPVSVQDHDGFCIIPEAAAVDIYCQLAATWVMQDDECADWLRSVCNAISSVRDAASEKQPMPIHVTLMAAGVCVWATDGNALAAALDVLAQVATIEPEQGPDFLPLFIFCLGYHSNPQLRLIFLEAMPKVATHKVTIAPTLKTLQMLSETDSLRPVALRLVTSLWRHQDRCFPYLQRMILAPSGGRPNLDTGLDEFVVAKAACIRDICELRPHQHGGDMLAPLSAILNECTRKEDEVPACLALEGLVSLCETEVVDIRTVWAVLAPKLSKDTRSRVVSRICDLFALVPDLSTNSSEYQEFKAHTLRSLWNWCQNDNAIVSSAAYRALRSYERADLILDVLPSAVTEDIREAIVESEIDSEPEEAPGICFVRLLEGLQEEVLPAYGDLLVSLVKDEVAGLPRGIYHSAISRQANRPSGNRTLSMLPDLIQQRYNNNKQPALRASLAAGLLFSFTPRMGEGRDGRVRRPAIVAHGRLYHQTLYSLLREVPLQASDWHCCMAIPQAWVSFMDHCFQAYQQSRTAELDIALDQGKVTDLDEHAQLSNTTWLWARDKLTDLIKSASRGGPAIQANCMLALAGLAVTTSRYSCGLDETAVAATKEATEHLGHAHWMSITASTLMSVLEPRYQPASRVFSMCQQSPGQSLSMASGLARGAAALALPLLVPHLLTSNTTILHEALNSLIHQVCGNSGTRGAVLPGLGLGTLIAKLTDEQFAHVAGEQGKTALWEAMGVIEKGSFEENDNRQGCLLGLAVCLPALCRDAHTDMRAHIATIHDLVTKNLKQLDEKDMAYTATGLCAAMLASSTYVTGHLTADDINRLVGMVHDAHCNDINDAGLAMALGAMCHGLAASGHPTISQLTAKLQSGWLECLLNQESSTLQRLCVLRGLLSLAGADASFFLSADDSDNKGSASAGVDGTHAVIQDVVKAIHDTSHTDITFHTAAAWRLGQLAMEAGSKGSSSSAVPNTYQYLPESSVLRPVIDRLIQAGKTSDLTGGQIVSLIRCLVEGPNRPLPPLNWTTLLSPLLRLSLEEQVTELCLTLSVRQASSAPTASLLLVTYMLPPLWNTLGDACKIRIVESLDKIMKSIPAPKLREFLTKSFMAAYESGEQCCSLTVQQAGLKGLRTALHVVDPPQAVTLALHQTLEKLYHVVPNQSELYCLLGDCLTEVPDQLIDDITKTDFTDGISFTKSSTIRCHLIGLGSQPFTWINPAIEMVMWENDSLLLYNASPKVELLALLAHCFYKFRLNQSKVVNTAKLSQWLLELMGHVRSIANGMVPPPEDTVTTAKAVEFLLVVFATVVVMMSGSTPSMVIPHIAMATCGSGKDQGTILPECLLRLLPQSLHDLVQRDEWKHMNSKILDWLISMYNIPVLSELPHWQHVIKGCLRAVRHTIDFRKMVTWTQAYML